MVKKKGEAKRTLFEELEDFSKAYDRDYPIIKRRWFVVETTPAYREHDEYDDYWVQSKSVRVSPYFDFPTEAETWMGEHEPDQGKTLSVFEDELRKFSYDRWKSESRI